MSIQEFLINIGKKDGTPSDRKLRTNFEITFSRQILGVNGKQNKRVFKEGELIYYYEKINDMTGRLIAVGIVSFESPKNFRTGWKGEDESDFPFNKIIHHSKLINVEHLEITIIVEPPNKTFRPFGPQEYKISNFTWKKNNKPTSKDHINDVLKYELKIN